MKTFVTIAVFAAGLATAGLVLTGNEAGAACPLQKASAGECCPTSAGCAEASAGCAKASAGCAEASAACPVDLTKKKATAAYAVSGMAGEGCSTKLTQVLGKIEGVGETKVCAKTGLTKVSYDPALVKKAQLLAAIQTTGYQLEGEVVELKVSGLDCGACSESVTKALTSVKGVKAQKVCTESKLATVTFDPVKTDREIIVAAIDKTGFKVVP